MRVGISGWEIGTFLIVLLAGYGLPVLFTTTDPDAAPAGPNAGIPAACEPGSRTGHANRDDSVRSSDGLRLLVRTPSDYDPTRAYPLLVVYPPAGSDRRQSERFYGLTTEATRRGFIVSYSNHLPLSRDAIFSQAKVSATVAARFCVDTHAIAYLGHSDGGAMAEGIPAFAPAGGPPPSAIVASAAGITFDDLNAVKCPPIRSVLIVHNHKDRRFPDFGRGTAAYWGSCASCKPAHLDSLTYGCHDFSGCAEGRRVTYCETSEPHKRWPGLNPFMLDFIEEGVAKSQ